MHNLRVTPAQKQEVGRYMPWYEYYTALLSWQTFQLMLPRSAPTCSRSKIPAPRARPHPAVTAKHQKWVTRHKVYRVLLSIATRAHVACGGMLCVSGLRQDEASCVVSAALEQQLKPKSVYSSCEMIRQGLTQRTLILCLYATVRGLNKKRTVCDNVQ